MRLKQSAGSDAVLLLMTLDVAVLSQQDLFKRFVSREEFVDSIGVAHSAFLLVGLISWLLALNFSEPNIRGDGRRYGKSSVTKKLATVWWAVSWVLVSFLFSAHALFFLLGPSGADV